MDPIYPSQTQTQTRIRIQIINFQLIIKMSNTNSPVIVTVDGHRYDVTAFLVSHPGEKIRNNKPSKSIRNYSDQDISEVFSLIHDSQESRKGARLFLDDARKNGQSVGIKYLGPAV